MFTNEVTWTHVWRSVKANTDATIWNFYTKAQLICRIFHAKVKNKIAHVEIVSSIETEIVLREVWGAWNLENIWVWAVTHGGHEWHLYEWHLFSFPIFFFSYIHQWEFSDTEPSRPKRIKTCEAFWISWSFVLNVSCHDLS